MNTSYFEEADMQHIVIVGLTFLLMLTGCSAESTPTSSSDTSAVSQNVDANDVATSASIESTLPTKPKHISIIVIKAAKKGEGGAECSGGMAATGELRCGPKSSLTKLSWEFTEHRGGSDFYKFNWALTDNGQMIKAKGLIVGFDGSSETTIIDEEHYIVIRKGSPDTDAGEAT